MSCRQATLELQHKVLRSGFADSNKAASRSQMLELAKHHCSLNSVQP